MATQEQRSRTTKAKLLTAFRTSFLERGFEATTMQQTLSETGLSKGAMYHHFRGKAEVIEALYEEEARGAIERAVASVEGSASALDLLLAMCLAWMEEVQEPSVSKILFDIGPSALGFERVRSIENEIALKRIESLLRRAVETGDAEIADVPLTAGFINVLVGEAAVHRLRTGEDPRATLKATMGAILDSLRPA